MDVDVDVGRQKLALRLVTLPCDLNRTFVHEIG